MSQNSDKGPSEDDSARASARVVPFERPQSEPQRAVQQRAQETIDLQRDRAAASRPPMWRRALVLVLAVIPVILTFGAAIAFVGALRQFHAVVFQSESAPETTPEQPATPQEPDVVILQPYVNPSGNPPSGSSEEGRTSTESPTP